MRKFKLKTLTLSVLMAFSLQLNAADMNIYSDGESELTQNYIQTTMDQYFHPVKKGVKPQFRPVNGWVRESFTVDKVPTEKYTQNIYNNKRVLLQCHGGGYILGLNDNYRKFALLQANALKADKVYTFDYRHAPKYLYPSALEDAVSVYKKILADGVNPENIIIAGDSAGGNLALVLSLKLKEMGIPQPRGLVLLSPWTAMNTLPSHKDNSTKDKVLGDNTPLNAEIGKISYANGIKPEDPRLSPLYADLKGLPPMLIQTGSYELLYSDSVMLKEALDKANVYSELKVYKGMPHDFPLVLPELPQTKESFSDFSEFADNIFSK
ncbi:MAG: alpha/beta hydrolase [Succinivibrio sp.]|nr:alpha/beta hydrolase [Succinivibrio sp.]